MEEREKQDRHTHLQSLQDSTGLFETDILTRRAYKTALGLFETTSTNHLLQLGVHNTLHEIADAQRAVQLERLSTTKAYQKILDNLAIG